MDPISFGADLVDQNGGPGDDILATHINNPRAWLRSIAALGLNANSETLAANKTLVDADEPVQYLDPTASGYTVELPAEASTNHLFYFYNTSATYDLVVYDDGATEIAAISPLTGSILLSDGIAWVKAVSGGPATQVDETGGPTTLDIGAIPSLSLLGRSGDSITGMAGGWIEVPDGSWTYASSTTITVPGGAASIYAIGDQVRLKQGGAYKYFYVTAVADSTLTVTGGSDFSVANSAITDAAFSKGGGVGHPGYFNYTPTVTYDGGAIDPEDITTNFRFAINKNTLFVTGSGFLTRGSGDRTNTKFSLPIIISSDSGVSISIQFATLLFDSTRMSSDAEKIMLHHTTMSGNGYYWLSGQAFIS
jgi:hypothetical protein